MNLNAHPKISQFPFLCKHSYVFRRERCRQDAKRRQTGGVREPSTDAAEGLETHLAKNAPADLARILLALAHASIEVAAVIRRGRLAGALDATVGPAHDGVEQKALDVFADETFLRALKGAGVRGVVSEERDDPDRSRRRWRVSGRDRSARRFLQHRRQHLNRRRVLGPRRRPRARSTPRISYSLEKTSRRPGFFIFGPHVAFAFTFGAGVGIATLDPDTQTYRMTTRQALDTGGIQRVRDQRLERAPLAGAGPRLCRRSGRGRRRSARAEFQHALDRLHGRRRLSHPGARRRLSLSGGFARGLRTWASAPALRSNPVAFLIEQAGGAAIDGFRRILEIEPKALHERTPLIFGSKTKVERIARYYAEGETEQQAPLFGRRGLLRR